MPPSLMDGTMRVPCIWNFPAEFARGSVTDALASHLDFAPTVLDLAGVGIPEGRVPPRPEAEQQLPPWPGKSLLPLLKGDAQSVQDSVIMENDADYLGMRQRGIVSDRYQLTAYVGETYGELFDLRNDPGQLNNRWDDPAFSTIKTELMCKLFHRFAETDSTLPRRLGHA